ncbi:MAG: hypothetical protein E6I62_06210 [Chloroflexi bacterium]|nr:MAG: hypothetical protein E6I62_06210 [Chloroflexota bacterium]
MTGRDDPAARRIFLAATGQNRGKTTASLGLIAGIMGTGHRLGFLKPVGQRYLVIDGTRADEDAVLVREVFDLPDALNDMSPVTLPRHFTTDFVMGRVSEDLAGQVERAFRRVAAGKDLVVIEGTGHAGVGAVVGMSNASVAALLGSKVIIVSEGGVGRPIDEIVLNASLFEQHGVQVLGAIVNKVEMDTHADLPEILRRGLAQHGIELIGCIPYSEFLANPSLELIVTHLQGELLAGEATPILASIAVRGQLVMGLILTGGFRPSGAVLRRLRDANLFTYLVETDTYTTAQAANAILVKTHPTDTEKIATIIDLVDGAIDTNALLERL